MTIQVLSGDFSTGSIGRIKHRFFRESCLSLSRSWWGNREEVTADMMGDLQVVSSETRKGIAAKAGWGAAGAAVLGPVGAVAGLLLGGENRPSKLVVSLSLVDGRQVLLDMDSKDYTELCALAFGGGG